MNNLETATLPPFRTLSIGVDPGKKGAVVALLDGTVPFHVECTPMVKSQYDSQKMAELLRRFMTLMPSSNQQANAVLKMVFEVMGKKAEEGLTHELNRVYNAMLEINPTYTNVVCILERQHAERGEGVSSVFTNGTGYGLWQGMLQALNIPHQIVTPTRWCRSLNIPPPKKKGDKTEHILACKRLLPEIDLRPGRRTKDHDGIADAALMAHYGHRLLVGSSGYGH